MGRGSQVVKDTDSLPECYEFEPGTAVQERPMHVKSVQLETPLVGVVWQLRKGIKVKVSSPSLDHGSE
ncbi:hypothetical protein TNCV_365891 [Trichonephila clavipes]|nr:hypothetical protein TNCV_365891 [Trichonephila clavipes]